MSRIFEITEKVRSYSPKADINLLNRAYVFAAQAHAEQHRSSGELYITHPLAVANILASLRLDVSSIATGLLHDTVEDTHVGIEDIREYFGDDVALLVDGVTKIGKIHFDSSAHKQVENFRKMILATAQDLRVLLVKLADRMHNMRTLGFVSPAKAKRVSEETMQLYAPLAHRLGIHWIKQEMEDIAFSYLEPDVYKQVMGRLQDKLSFLQGTQKRLEHLLQEALLRQGLKAKVQGRMKHLYSLHQKMQRKHIDFDEIYDIVAFRLIVADAPACYHALGIIHSLYRPVPGRFKDYIALPKPNGYQSLHTSVIGPEQHRIEVQIRAESMHQHAEDGVAAHWLYKDKDGSVDDSEQREYVWLRQLTEILQSSEDPSELMENVRLDLFVQEVYVFSRDGDIYALPRGAKPLDFAYAVHTDVGNHCIGVRINGEMMELKTKLRNGDQIEILTSPDQEPSRRWLSYVRTSKARQAIRQYYHRQDRKVSIQMGQKILHELLSREPPKALLDVFHCEDTETLCMKLGRGDLSVEALLKVLDQTPAWQKKLRGVSMTSMHGAHCCYPIPGDAVLGHVIKGKGMEVHYRDCVNLNHKKRYLEMNWKPASHTLYPTGIEVVTENRRGMLSHVSGCISSAEANIDDLKIDQRTGEMTVLRILVAVHDRKHLAKVLRALKSLDGVVKVMRRNQVGLGENYKLGFGDMLRGMMAKGRRSLLPSKKSTVKKS